MGHNNYQHVNYRLWFGFFIPNTRLKAKLVFPTLVLTLQILVFSFGITLHYSFYSSLLLCLILSPGLRLVQLLQSVLPEGRRRCFCPSSDTFCSSDLYLCTFTSLVFSPPLCLSVRFISTSFEFIVHYFLLHFDRRLSNEGSGVNASLLYN